MSASAVAVANEEMVVNEIQVNHVVALMDSSDQEDVVNFVFDEVVSGSMNRVTFDTVIDTMLARVEEVTIQEVCA